MPPLFEKGASVLFQGDSITDMGRGRTLDPNHLLGHGYVFLVCAEEAAAFPERAVTFINRGISGNETGQLAERWKADALDLKPDVLSILIGVNDLNHALKGKGRFPMDKYERAYDKLLAAAVAAVPGVKLILGEPFYAVGDATAVRWEEREAAMAGMRAVVERLGAKYRAAVVHYQKMFDAAAERAPAPYWIWDGVHPTFAGHQLMAGEWRRAYSAFHGPALESNLG